MPSCSDNPYKSGEIRNINYIGSYRRDFNDMNDKHIGAAREIGLSKPIESIKEVEEYTGDLELIESNDLYVVMPLTHSSPYLVEEADKLLMDIAQNFRDTLISYNAPLYRLRVTSVTRTKEHITKLQRRNYNSIENSAHTYATTFDISWSKYDKVDPEDPQTLGDDQLKRLFAMVLRDLRKQERCFIKHERRQGCFHITACEID